MGIGSLFVVAAPSGTGKTTLVKALVSDLPNLAVSISHTTRPKRPNEEHGLNYFFTEEKEFLRMIDENAFLEHAKVFGHRYGTAHQFVQATLEKGVDVILEIDWQGMQQIKALFPKSVSIFILPPCLANLKERLVKRNQDKPQVIEERLADVKETISHIKEFDYIVINDDFDQALVDLIHIVEADRLQRSRQVKKYAKLIQELA